jgi:hypothetical protein
MYKVAYYRTGGSAVDSKEFETLAEAVDFSNKLPIESVLEIKHYDSKINNIQNEPYDSR